MIDARRDEFEKARFEHNFEHMIELFMYSYAPKNDKRFYVELLGIIRYAQQMAQEPFVKEYKSLWAAQAAQAFVPPTIKEPK